MEYKELIERLKKETYWVGGSHPYSHDVHPLICDEAAEAITSLLARAEAAEVRAKKAEKCIFGIEEDIKFGRKSSAALKICEWRVKNGK